jgi:hypothetical protein
MGFLSVKWKREKTYAPREVVSTVSKEVLRAIYRVFLNQVPYKVSVKSRLKCFMVTPSPKGIMFTEAIPVPGEKAALTTYTNGYSTNREIITKIMVIIDLLQVSRNL